VEDREPSSLGALERHALGSTLLERSLAHDDLAEALPSVRGAGGLPLGAVGACAFADLLPEVEQLSREAAGWMQGDRPEPVPVDVTVGGTRITGVLSGVWPAAQLVHGFGRFDARRLLDIWIRHLVLACVGDGGQPSTSVLVARPGRSIRATSIILERADDADARLRDLLEVFSTGQRVALPLFPAASLEYADAWRRAEHLDGPDRRAAAMRRASGTFHNRHGAPGDAWDAYVIRAFGRRDPIDEEPDFPDLALRVFDPLLSSFPEEA
jgi:exodeoxyribonuclease V gamma subunit